MRPKLLALLAVPAIVLVGCSTAETPSTTPEATTAAPTANVAQLQQAPEPEESSDTKAEDEFVDYAQDRFKYSLAMEDEVPEKEILKEFRDYCIKGDPFEFPAVAKGRDKGELVEENFSKTLAAQADSRFCEQLSK